MMGAKEGQERRQGEPKDESSTAPHDDQEISGGRRTSSHRTRQPVHPSSIPGFLSRVPAYQIDKRWIWHNELSFIHSESTPRHSRIDFLRVPPLTPKIAAPLGSTAQAQVARPSDPFRLAKVATVGQHERKDSEGNSTLGDSWRLKEFWRHQWCFCL